MSERLNDGLDRIRSANLQYSDKLDYQMLLWQQIDLIRIIKASVHNLLDGNREDYFEAIQQLQDMLYPFTVDDQEFNDALKKIYSDLRKEYDETKKENATHPGTNVQQPYFGWVARDLLKLCLKFMQKKGLLLSETEKASFE